MKKKEIKIRKPKREVIDVLMGKDKQKRLFICEREFMYFCIYYFHDFFSHKLADFHLLAYQLLKFEKYKYYILEWYREAGKTTMVKMYITWCICFKKKNYMIYICYEKDTAKQHLYDIVFWLQTNKLIIEDFGQLFYEDTTGKNKFSQKKSVEEFITTNKVKVEASSTQEPLRGRVYGKYRPDFLVFDDFENEKTKRSFHITQGIIKNMDEALAGIGGSGNIIYLCNYISDLGSVEMLHGAARKDPLMYYHRVDVVEDIKDPDNLESGRITWKHKYVFTDEEADAINKEVKDKTRHVVSLEAKRRSLNKDGRHVFEQEMLNQPIVKGDKLFDPNIVRTMIANDACAPKSFIGDWMMWNEKYDPHHRYAIGADVAEGVGSDSSAAVLIDFSSHGRAEIIGTYANNAIAPDIFAHELENIGRKFGMCLVAPELNNQGYATLSKLKEIYGNIYEQEGRNDYIQYGKEPTKYGWVTNAKTKPEIIFDLRTAISDNLLLIHDEELLLELLSYNQGSLKEIRAKEGMTRHFDKLMALAIAWRMRDVSVSRGDRRVVYDEEYDVHDLF